MRKISMRRRIYGTKRAKLPKDQSIQNSQSTQGNRDNPDNQSNPKTQDKISNKREGFKT